MGAKAWMAGSIRRAAEIVGLIHVAGLRAAEESAIKAYPVIDGVYLVGDNKSEFKKATKSVMRNLAITFLARKSEDRFLVRAGIAYGRILHGESITPMHSGLQMNESYSKCLAIGVAIGQAFSAEGKAPPFGYYVDMTARSTASINDAPYISSFYRWWTSNEGDKVSSFATELNKHFDYLEQRHRELEYPIDRLKEHRSLAQEYFQINGQNPL